MENAYRACGPATEMTTAEIIRMKTRVTAHSTRVVPASSVAEMVDASSSHGNATTRTIAETAPTKMAVPMPIALKDSSLVPTSAVFQ